MTVQKIMVKKNHTVKSYDINHGFYHALISYLLFCT